ncbi:MAG: long-chain fatty acid--CoA ligase [Myxococcales bacterium]|nr:long-chain fatty acid--CoA ligase [Myxococcales bacterium]
MHPDPSELASLSDYSLSALLRRAAARWPDARALLGGHQSWTWAQLDRDVDQVACLFEACGVKPGDPVGFLLSKRPEVVIGFLACARMGAIQVPVNFKLHPDQVSDQFTTAHIRAVVTEGSQEALLKHLLPLLPDPRQIISVDATGRHAGTRWASHVQHAGHRSAFEPGPDTVCYYNYTSGSTGRPKGASTTSRNIIANGIATSEGLGFEAGDVYMGMFSVFAHPHELFHRSILFGGAFVVVDSLNPRMVADAINAHGVTWMMAVPSFYEMLLDHLDGGAASGAGGRLPSLRVLEAGGAYVSPETHDRMETKFKARFLPVWGCTEASGVGLGMLAGNLRRAGSTGKAIPGYEIRIVDAAGDDVSPGEAGELWIKGPSVISHYVNMPAETAAQFKDGWYATTDLVKRDEDGFIFFAGRRSEMLKIGGIRVFPLEIEQVVQQHPEVRDVVVVRAEERLRGEIPRAIVTTQPGSGLTVRSLQAYCRDRMALYKVPRIVEFWAEIPKLPNGKIDKRAVSAQPQDPERDDRRPPSSQKS